MRRHPRTGNREPARARFFWMGLVPLARNHHSHVGARSISHAVSVHGSPPLPFASKPSRARDLRRPFRAQTIRASDRQPPQVIPRKLAELLECPHRRHGAAVVACVDVERALFALAPHALRPAANANYLDAARGPQCCAGKRDDVSDQSMAGRRPLEVHRSGVHHAVTQRPVAVDVSHRRLYCDRASADGETDGTWWSWHGPVTMGPAARVGKVVIY